MVIQQATWDALVESSLRQASTPAACKRSACKALCLTKERVAYWMTNKPREVGQIDPPLRKTIRQLVGGELPWPLMLMGPAGCGKTCAALCLLDHSSGFYYTAAGLAEALIVAQQGRLLTPQSGRMVYPETLWHELGRAALAVLDELGAREKVSEFHYDCVKRLLDEREGLPLVCLSNLSVEALARIYDDRVTSRLMAGTAVSLEGADRRLT